MEDNKNYRRNGDPDFKVAIFRAIAGGRMAQYTHWHEELEIYYQLSGQAHIQIGKEIFRVSAGEIYIIMPNEVHGLRSFSADAVNRNIVIHMDAITMPEAHFFQKNFVRPLWEGRLALPRCILQDHPAHEEFMRQFARLDACRIFEPNYKGMRLALIMSLCAALLPYTKPVSGQKQLQDPGNEAIKLCLRYLHNCYAEKITLTKIANHVHLHPNYVCALFKEHTGERIFDYLIRLRVETAATILRRENIPVSKLAEKVGFSSESLFYQKFKQLMGMSPKAYRRAQEKNSDTEE